MALSEGTLAVPASRRHVLPAMVGAAAAVLLPALALGLVDGQVIRVGLALAAVATVVRGYAKSGSRRERRVRAWITAALVVWAAAELARLGGLPTTIDPVVAAVTTMALGTAAVGTYAAAARGRMRPADETALYLDAASIFLSTGSAVLVFGVGLVHDPIGLAVLFHAAFFVAILCSTLLLDLSLRVPLRATGPWEILMGLALGAFGYIWLIGPLGVPVTDGVMSAVVGVGALLVGHGGANWTAAEDNGARYRAIAGSLRTVLPLISLLVTGIAAVTMFRDPALMTGGLRIVTGLGLGMAVLSAIARQTVLLADRERVIRKERELTDELTVAEAQYRSVVARVPGVVYVAEAGEHGRWHFVSAKIEELLGYTPEEWTADPMIWMSRMHPADRERMILAESGEQGRSEPKGRWEYRLFAKDGRMVWVIDDEAVIARDADGRATMVQGILVDISDRKSLEEQLRHQALHDPLTGLPNRVLFVDRLTHALVRRNGDHRVAVLFVDLDEFKVINDTLGHAAGDELLRLVGERLAGVLRAEDTASRLSGDEFAFLLEDAPRHEVEAVAERILAALAREFTIGEHTVTLGASIGIAIGHPDASGNASAETADELLRDADTAMYAAKARGKSCVQVFERGMEEPVKRRRELRGALEVALATDQLMLEYQPIIDMCDGSLVGVEALVRWDHPQMGRLMPADFIGLAEESGLIGPLGAWVLRTAAADLAVGSTMLSVNVSAHQLDGGLPDLVADVLRETGLDPARLLLELTESTLASAGAGAEAELEKVQQLGVRIALDDFGSGYSSLEYLGRLPIDVLKIDRSLVERVDVEPQRQEVLRAIGHIAVKLGVETIVEGIEREEQRAELLRLGFCRAQGYLFARPLPLAAALDPARPLLSPVAVPR